MSCVHHEIADEDHFSIIERLSESDYCLTKVEFLVSVFISNHVLINVSFGERSHKDPAGESRFPPIC